MRRLMLGILFLNFAINGHTAAPPDVVQQMTFFAIKLGRALACSLESGEESSKKVGIWLDKKLKAGTPEKGEYLMAFSTVMLTASKRQTSGESSEPCGDVAKYFKSEEFSRALSR